MPKKDKNWPGQPNPTMKQLLVILFITATLGYSSAQDKQTREVPVFREISYRLPGKLYLRQGSPQKVELMGDTEDLQHIETEVRGDRLILSDGDRDNWFNWRNENNHRITVYITVQDIDAISVSGSGDLLAETKINSSRLDLRVSGSGSLEAEVSVSGDLEADVSGSGDLKVKGNCGNLSSRVSGSGKVYIANAIEGKADFSLSGSGKILAAGRARLVKAGISGSGKVLAADLETERCEVKITGSGDVEINVKSELDAQISGSGTVAYKGNPNHVNSHASGSGKLRKM